MKIDTVLNRIKSFRLSSGLNTSQWAERVGVGDTTFRDMMTDRWNPTASTIRKCEAVIPPEFMTESNDNELSCSTPQAGCADRGEDQSNAA
ncbi:helix-turn-helix domain-containing protein [Thalassospira sp. SM2505]